MNSYAGVTAVESGLTDEAGEEAPGRTRGRGQALGLHEWMGVSVTELRTFGKGPLSSVLALFVGGGEDT